MCTDKYSNDSMTSMSDDGFSHVQSKLSGHHNAAGHHLHAAAVTPKRIQGTAVICSCNHGNGKDCRSTDGTCKCCQSTASTKGSRSTNDVGELNASGDGYTNASGKAWDETVLIQKYKGLLNSTQALKLGLNKRNKAAAKEAIEDLKKYVADLDKLI